MDWSLIVLALIGAVGGGGIVAIVQAISNRKKVRAEAHKIEHEAHEVAARAETILIENYTNRLLSLDQRTNEQDCKISQQGTLMDELKENIRTLYDEIRGRDQKIQELENLKTIQQKEIEKLQDEVKERDRRISDQTRTIEHLATRVTELEAALKRLQDGKPC